MPPPAAVAFVPLALLPAPIATTFLTGASVVALARIVVLASRAIGQTPAWWWAPAAAATEPVVSTLIYGQVNIVVVWLCLEGYLHPNDRRGGVLIGLGVALKLTPALFLLPLILRRRWDAVGAGAVAFGTSCVAGALAAPAASAHYWTRIASLSGRVGLDFPTDQSYTGALARLVGTPMASTVGTALGLATIGLLAWALIRNPGDPLRDAVTTWLAGLAWVVAMAAWPDLRSESLATVAPLVALVLSDAYLLLGMVTLIALARCRPARGGGGSGREECCAVSDSGLGRTDVPARSGVDTGHRVEAVGRLVPGSVAASRVAGERDLGVSAD